MVYLHVYWYILAVSKIPGFLRPDRASEYHLKIEVLPSPPDSTAALLQRAATVSL